MAERLNQPSSVKEDSPMDFKLLFREGKVMYVYIIASIPGISIG